MRTHCALYLLAIRCRSRGPRETTTALASRSSLLSSSSKGRGHRPDRDLATALHGQAAYMCMRIHTYVRSYTVSYHTYIRIYAHVYTVQHHARARAASLCARAHARAYLLAHTGCSIMFQHGLDCYCWKCDGTVFILLEKERDHSFEMNDDLNFDAVELNLIIKGGRFGSLYCT